MPKLLTTCQTCGGPRKFRTRKNRPGTESYCPPCNSKRTQAWYDANPVKKKCKTKAKTYRAWMLKTKYNMTLDQFNNIMVQQKNCCFICKQDQSKFKKTFAVDHNHKTGAVRHLLCDPCNQALGLIKENFETALALAQYIQEDQGVI